MAGFLKDAGGEYDLVLAADVLIYAGELGMIFAVVVRRLAAGGLLVFSIGGLEEGTYERRPTGRYAQSDADIRGLAADHGLRVASCEAIVGRTENDRPIDGFLFALESAAG